MTLNRAFSLCTTDSVTSTQSSQFTYSICQLLELESLLNLSYRFASLRWCQKWSLATFRKYRSQDITTITSEHFPWPLKPKLGKLRDIQPLFSYSNPVSWISRQNATAETTNASVLGEVQYGTPHILAVESLRNQHVSGEQLIATCFTLEQRQPDQTSLAIDGKDQGPLLRTEEFEHHAPRRNRANSLFIRQYALDCHARNVSYTLPPKSGIQADDTFCRAYLGRNRLRQFHQKHNIFHISELSRQKLCKCCVLPPRQDHKTRVVVTSRRYERCDDTGADQEEANLEISQPIVLFPNYKPTSYTSTQTIMLMGNNFTRDKSHPQQVWPAR